MAKPINKTKNFTGDLTFSEIKITGKRLDQNEGEIFFAPMLKNGAEYSEYPDVIPQIGVLSILEDTFLPGGKITGHELMQALFELGERIEGL